MDNITYRADENSSQTILRPSYRKGRTLGNTRKNGEQYFQGPLLLRQRQSYNPIERIPEKDQKNPEKGNQKSGNVKKEVL